MGAGRSAPEDEARAQEAARQLQYQQRQQEEEIRRKTEALQQERADRAEARRVAREREDEEERRADKRARELLEQRQKAQQEAQMREDQMRAENEAQLRRTMDDGAAALERQRDINAAEKMKQATDHQNAMRKALEQVEKAETRTAERVLDLTKQKDEQQQKLHSEKIGYADRQLAETKEHNAKLEVLAEKRTAILMEREQNAIDHKDRLHVMQVAYTVQDRQIKIAAEQDRKEMNFVDAVNAVRSAGGELTTTVSGAVRVETHLKNKLPLNTKAINQCKSSRERALRCLAVLLESADAILRQQEANNSQTAKCHEIARSILTTAADLESKVRDFNAFLDLKLDKLETKREGALEAIGEIKRLQRALFETINGMPVVHRSNHVQAQCIRNVEAIVGQRVTIRGKEAIKDESGGGVVEEAD